MVEPHVQHVNASQSITQSKLTAGALTKLKAGVYELLGLSDERIAITAAKDQRREKAEGSTATP